MERDWSDFDGVEVIPGKVSGVPVLKHSRVPADLVADELDDGETIDEIAYNHDLKPSDVLRLKIWRESHPEPAMRR